MTTYTILDSYRLPSSRNGNPRLVLTLQEDGKPEVFSARTIPDAASTYRLTSNAADGKKITANVRTIRGFLSVESISILKGK
jgi:hypothetical protein